MCRSSTEPGGPRRCSSDTRAGYRRAAATLSALEHRCSALDAQNLYRTVTVPFTMPLPAGVEPVLQAARSAGNPLVVGGAVRDATLGVSPKDIDIEVHGAAIDTLLLCFRQEGFEVDEVGKQFGVLKVSKPGVLADLDVSVPRRDSKIAAGHRGFAVALDTDMTVTEAAARRDFTVNAMLYDPHRKVLIDPFGGQADLQNRTLRHVSDQFSEDPLRVLRGAQLAGRFGMTLHPDTAALCRRLRPHFNELAVERIREEWSKLFTKAAYPHQAVRALQDSGWDDTLPGLKGALADPGTTRALAVLPGLPVKERVTIGAAIIATSMPAEYRVDFVHHTVTGSHAARIAGDLASTPKASLDTTYARKRFAEQMSKRGFTFGRYRLYAQALHDPEARRIARAAISEGLGGGPEPAMIQGRDVMAAAAGRRKPGPWVGALVSEALDRQHRGDFATRSAALRWLDGRVPPAP